MSERKRERESKRYAEKESMRQREIGDKVRRRERERERKREDTTTGPAHWELLTRARALDNQLYIATVSPARDETATYHACGHNTLVSPW